MVSSRYEPVRADTAARPWLPRQVLPLQCTEVPGNGACGSPSHSSPGEKNTVFSSLIMGSWKFPLKVLLLVIY